MTLERAPHLPASLLAVLPDAAAKDVCQAGNAAHRRRCLVPFFVAARRGPPPFLVDEVDQMAQTHCATMRPSHNATSLDV